MTIILQSKKAASMQKRAESKQQNPNFCAGTKTMKMRGKEREKPKVKKPTKLKQSILVERQQFHSVSSVENEAIPGPHSNPADLTVLPNAFLAEGSLDIALSEDPEQEPAEEEHCSIEETKVEEGLKCTVLPEVPSPNKTKREKQEVQRIPAECTVREYVNPKTQGFRN